MAERPIDLGWVRVFAAVGKMGSLSSAAGTLGLTQPAVSYQIRRLEEHLGVSLLQRQHRGVELTAEGRRLFDVTSRAVDDIDMLVRSFRSQSERPAIRLRTDYAFSSLWLIPRMHSFRLLYPEMDIQIVATQRMEHGPPDGDIAVVFGTRQEFGSNATLLLPERVVPICTQGFLDRNGPFFDPFEIASARLLHLDTRAPSPWFDWKSYLAELGINRDAAVGQGELSFNTYSLVVQAAIGEQGLAIGWMGLVDSLLSSRMLVTAGPMLEATDRGYWLLPPKAQSAETDRLAAWLISEAGIDALKAQDL
ncbi:putative choline sulfate-utilization transcription factor [Rhizobium mongolense subsp. loessense]|uniref:HTH-type transcriptional regulator TtuA n=1 Tax=Rhizobium mongolense subsp. loessense TaxID=158890 RepID=A0A1G4Q005_9HYPH|nr:LysR family transcriptional regulator [Rhizobium mongolense]SCW37787.1 putative choline sulfate-utilization transcription factor [Rhizobium mongolense subsp. loessense]